MGELLSILYDLWSILTQLADAINDGEMSGLNYICKMFPDAIQKIFEHPDFITIYEIMIPIGSVLAVVYVSLDIMEKATITEFTVDQIILSFVKLIVAIGLINNGIVLFEGLNDFASMITEIALNQALGADMDIGTLSVAEATFPEIGKDVLSIIIAVFNLLNPANIIEITENALWLVFFLLLVPIAAYQRAIRVGIYCLLSPIVMADVAGHGLKNSNAIKFVFGLLSVMMEFPITAIGIYFGLQLFGDGGAYEDMVPFACVMIISTMLFKSKNYIKTLF